MTYSRYVMSAVLALHLEGVSRWDDAIMMRISNGFTGYVIDIDISSVTSIHDTIAAGVTGTRTVASIPPTTYRSRLTVGKYTVTNISAFAVWDASGELEGFSRQAYAVTESDESRPLAAYIPASMLFLETASARDLGFAASR